MNVGADFSAAIGAGGLLSSPNPAGGSFDLNDLDEHNFPIEHDASLSREDFHVNGNDYGFNQTVFDSVVAYFHGTDATVATAAKAKFNRVVVERARDARFQYGPREFVLSYGETALYLSVMGDPITGVAPVKYVKVFFGEFGGWVRGSVAGAKLLTGWVQSRRGCRIRRGGGRRWCRRRWRRWG